MESILHLCKRSFTTKMLRWHYRSRHQSLIAVSNQEYYDNHLLIYPSPCNGTEKLGLKFVHLPDAVTIVVELLEIFIEAKAVVKAILDHYRKYGNKKSLGVGTFNLNQKRLIEDFLEIELKKNPNMEEYFSESHYEKFFIKNLETIQGDERDVIFVSVGFGFDSDRKLRHNFGHINHDGGERRLNVLFTRSRERCVVFSNFKASDLKIGPNSAFGIRSLKPFLEYAETSQLVSIVSPGEDTDSPFEDSVYEVLRDYGFEIHKQVGCTGFRIDLAIVNHKSSGRYLLCIECDGAMYHSSPVARDRDRLRQQILEGFGWKIHRIWSTDWYRNRDESMQRLLNAIEKAKIKEVVLEIPSNEEENSLENEEGIDLPEKNMEILVEVRLEDSIPEYELCLIQGIDTLVNYMKTPDMNLLEP